MLPPLGCPSLWMLFLFSLMIADGRRLWQQQVRPPAPRWGPNTQMLRKHNSVAFERWTKDNVENIWELSGLYEGDIMLYPHRQRNGLLNEKLTWPDAVVPFYIDTADFNDTQVMIILKGFQEYHERTCVRFRPYQAGDANWIVFKGNYTGCWSSVGRHQGGQVINLNAPKCVRHGVVVHELLHALGFYHQQSSTKRDEYVRINWANILDGHAHNFNKYARTHISNYGVEYDYGSVMHYSSRAFSKNGHDTIEPLDPNAKLGQRLRLSDKDVAKLNEMYSDSCPLVDYFDPLDLDLGDYVSEIIAGLQQSFNDFFARST